MNTILTLETKKYEIKLENFEGPLDLLCHLVDKNKMDITKVNISQIADQYIDYIEHVEKEKLEVTSEFLVMASTLLYLKSKTILPNAVEEEEEITEEELIRRIIEYKKYKEISKKLKDKYEEYGNRIFRFAEKVELPKQELNMQYAVYDISDKYNALITRNVQKINQNAKNIEQIAITETVTVASKVKQIFKELAKKPKLVFNKIFCLNNCSKMEIVTAFSGLLELSRRNKVLANQETNFGDITVERFKK